MNKKIYSVPVFRVTELDSTVVCGIGGGGGTGSPASVEYDSSTTESGSGFDDVQEFDWRE